LVRINDDFLGVKHSKNKVARKAANTVFKIRKSYRLLSLYGDIPRFTVV